MMSPAMLRWIDLQCGEGSDLWLKEIILLKWSETIEN